MKAANLKHCLGSITLDIITVGDDLQHAVPHLLAHIVACNADEVEDGVHIPSVVHCILLSKDGHLQHLRGRQGPQADATQDIENGLAHKPMPGCRRT